MLINTKIIVTQRGLVRVTIENGGKGIIQLRTHEIELIEKSIRHGIYRGKISGSEYLWEYMVTSLQMRDILLEYGKPKSPFELLDTSIFCAGRYFNCDLPILIEDEQLIIDLHGLMRDNKQLDMSTVERQDKEFLISRFLKNWHDSERGEGNLLKLQLYLDSLSIANLVNLPKTPLKF